MGLQAIIFDLDGVLIDSEPVGIEIAQQLLSEAGIPTSTEALSHFVGVPDRDFYADVGSQNEQANAMALLHTHTETYESLLDSIPIIPGAIETVKRCSQFAPLALVSGSTRRQIDRVLERLGLASIFEVIVSADDVEFGKPDPHGFRRAARKLGVQEIACVVVEDSPSGLRAAQAAGMCTIAYSPSIPERIIQKECTSVSSLSEITEDLLTRLIHTQQSNGLVLKLGDGWQKIAVKLGERLRSADYLLNTDPFDPWSLLKRPRQDSLYRLFAAGDSVSADVVEPLLDGQLLQELIEIRVLISSNGRVQSRGTIASAFGQLLLIDRPVSRRPDLWHSAQTYLDESTVSYITSIHQLVGSLIDRSVLEIGPGSGLACILFAHAGASFVLGLDIDPAAVNLSQFNAALNGADKPIQIERSDMFDYLDGTVRTFDVITFHPPYRIVPPNLTYPNPTQRIGPTEDGLGLVRRLIKGLPGRLNDGGRALVSVQLPNYRDTKKSWSLDNLAEQQGLTLKISDVGDEISIEDTSRSIAAKLDQALGDVESQVRDYYEELGICSLRPSLLIISQSK